MRVITDWAALWGVPPAALQDLQARMLVAYGPTGEAMVGSSEAAVQAHVRLEAAKRGIMLFRNNVGAMKDDRGRLVRYGLANDTAALNRSIKSADLIGWRREVITAEMVGTEVARFVSVEVKAADWGRGRSREREEAQARWAALVNANGGLAFFSTGGMPE